MTQLCSPEQIQNQIKELMAVTKTPREFKTFKKFRQSRDAQVKELFSALRAIIYPPGLRIKRANERTYEVQSDGSHHLVDPEREQLEQEKFQAI